MKKIQIKSSIGMFDFLKGITMIIVVTIHTFGLFPTSLFYSCAYKADFASHPDMNFATRMGFALFSMLFVHYMMPALFVVSGYGFRKQSSLKKVIIKQAKTLLIPYMITAIITCVVHFISHYTLYHSRNDAIYETLKLAGGFLLGLPETTNINGRMFFSCGPSWFLLALFWSILIFNILVKYFDGIKLLLVSFVIGCIGWIVPLVLIGIPWCIPYGCIATFFFCLGYLAKKKKIYFNGIGNIYKVLFVALIVVPNIRMRYNGYNAAMPVTVNPLGAIAVLEIGVFSVLIVYLYMIPNAINGKIISGIRSLGRVSIYFLCIHTIEMMGFPLYYFADKWTGNLDMGAFFLSLIRLAVDITL